MLGFEEAIAKMLSLGARVGADAPTELVGLDDADGRVLAEDVAAPADMPAFDYSAMDGYALRSVDLSQPSSGAARLAVVGESRTGRVPPELARGTAMRVFTGAPLPAGADAVVMQEQVARDGDVAVLDPSAVRPGQHVRRRGEDLAAGTLALRRGTRLRPAHLSLAAALDRAALRVAARPRVIVIATGDELRAPGTPARAGSIPESNTVALRAMARRAGAVTDARSLVPDDRVATERAFADALDEADVVVSVGGVSVGDHDLVRPALAAVGVTLDFWRVALRPGKPLAIGTLARPGRPDAVVVGLPGNPVSALITFAMFGAPLLRAMQGDTSPISAPVRARITRAYRHQPGRLELARAFARREGDHLVVTPIDNQSSGAPTTMAHANALVRLATDSAGVAAGEEVDVLMMDDIGV